MFAPLHPSVHSFTHSFTHSLTHSFTFIHSFFHPSIHPFIHPNSSIHSFTFSFLLSFLPGFPPSFLPRYEGVRALFVSFPTTLLMNIPYGGVMVATNESLKTILNPSGERNVPAFFLSGAGAGALAAVVTNPLDVAKTRLQTQCMLLTPVSAPSIPGLALPPLPAVLPNSVVVSMPGTVAAAAAGGGGMGTATTIVSSSSSAAGAADGLAAGGGVGGREIGRARGSGQKKCEAPRCNAQGPTAGVESCKVVRFTGLVETLRTIMLQEGPRGFIRGLRPRLMVHIPAVATTWTTYEVVKRMLVEYNV